MALCTAGSVTPLSALKTIWPWTWRSRKLDWSSRSKAAWLSVPGSLNSVWNAPPIAPESAKVPIRATIQADEDATTASVHRASESFEHGGGTSRSSGSGASRIGAAPPTAPGDRSLQSPPASRGRAEGEERRRWPTSPSTGSTARSASPKWSGRPMSPPQCATRCATSASVMPICSPARAARARPRWRASSPRHSTARIELRTATRAACATTASVSPTAASWISSSSTPRRTTASKRCATSPRACTSVSAPRRRTRCT